jgi:hypothetical protein
MHKAKLSAEVSKLFAKWGRKGGRNAAKTLREGRTPEQVAATMRAVANARWHPRVPPAEDVEAAS